MTTLKNGDKVHISFVGTLDNGDIFKEIKDDDNYVVTIDNNELPPTIETDIIGMEEGEEKKIRVPPDEGYGPRLKDLLHEVPVSSFGDKITPKPGMILSQKVEKDGAEHTVPATIMEVKDDIVVIDYNHPMAGHFLNYAIKIIKILN
ncbi:MAG: hypothetical protein D6B25_16495 [Desulfobulbaceae bacterium]|nr:MAG: hypothetical protein D6B25_16495 [Desulfobulbaceae bacterium]